MEDVAIGGPTMTKDRQTRKVPGAIPYNVVTISDQEVLQSMCGIAGVVDLSQDDPIDPQVIARMSQAIVHRGPDEEGVLFEPGLAFASRRLSIIDLADGQQPMFNEDRTVAVVFNGEIFEHPEVRAKLTAKGHRFRTLCDTEVLAHLWEEYGEQMLDHVRGQFAFALYDYNRRIVLLARDRTGICPLHWATEGGKLYFGSEIKALLASGAIRPEVDVQGLNHIFTLFALPSQRTAFRGVRSLLPGQYLKIKLGRNGEQARISEHRYWDLDFPDRGEEYHPEDPQTVVDEFTEIFREAVRVRLRADVPVVSYLSGGVDSATVMAVASELRGEPIPSFTIKIDSRRYNEEDKARAIADHFGSKQTVVACDSNTLCDAFHELIRAADSPVVDTACAALFCLSKEVRDQGYKVALTGEGADEALAGYPWFKINRLINTFGGGGSGSTQVLRRIITAVASPHVDWKELRQDFAAIGGYHGPADLYALLSGNRSFFQSDVMKQINGGSVYHDLQLDVERIRRWHPLNQSLYLGYKTILPGLLMNHKGDRVAMANSVETRYPFLDEDLIGFCATLSPRWKLRGILKDKYVLRQMANNYLPKHIAQRPKAMFRAPFGDTLFQSSSPIVQQLLSRESLEKTGYFNPIRVQQATEARSRLLRMPGRSLFDEMGLISVFSTQLWHHLYLGGGLCELPTWTPPTVKNLPTPVTSASTA